MKSLAFTHLHVHTQYSLLDGAARISELVNKAVELGMDSLAITDHGCMYGEIEFYKTCVKCGIKPILGMEAYVAPHSHLEKQGGRDSAHLVLLAKNETGYKNLMKLSSIAYVDGFYYRPRIDYDLLEQYHSGIICLSACLAGDIPSMLYAGRYDAAEALALRLKNMFGDDFYIEIQNHGLPEQLDVLPRLVSLAEKLSIKLVATNDIHYVDKSDAEAQDALLCIQTNRYVDEENRMKMATEEFYLKSEQEMTDIFFDYPESLSSTQEIADKCNVKISFGERHLPGFTAPNGMTNDEYLRVLCKAGLEHKMPDADEAAWDKLWYEVSVIIQMGFVDYFLIVWDFVNYAHEHGIFVGPGRGSGAGSLVAYALDITDIDPLKYDLIFERFLNPERVSMPDFDIDFCIERRQEVIDYVISKYGADHVAQIITFGSMAAKAVIRDVGRVLRMPYGDVDRIAKLVPNELGITLKHALELSTELKELYDNDASIKKLLDLSQKLEGLPRHASTHAAGVVICASPTVEYVPLQRNEDAVTTQFPKDTIEELGLLKMDFLGLRTLTVIRDALELIKTAGKEVPCLEKLEFNDLAIFDMISRADTDGVFQLESMGMRQFMMQLKPDNFEDIIAGISLFRPGPMQQIPRYIAGKADRSSVTYPDERMRPILEKTYGCMVYQEQVMQIVRDIAGYSWGRSDLVRRAMAKKKHEVMAKEREYFIYGITDEEGKVTVPGAVRNGVDAKTANRIFDEMIDFASYAFNKSHAAAYAVVAYRTAYLKLYYPVEFMTALINSFLASSDKIADYIATCKRIGISVLSPDINKSYPKFSVEGESIRFGLGAIRNVGALAMDDMVKKRDVDGKYKDFFDFVRRAGDGLNKRMLEGLIKAGCFDSTGAKRSQLMAVYEAAADAAASDRKQRESGQISLFDIASDAIADSISIALPDRKEYTTEEMLAMEREATGIYVSGHPLSEYEEMLRSFKVTAAMLTAADGEGAIKDGQRYTVGGIITASKTKATKSGSGLMCYATLEDMSGSVELAVFPSVFQKYAKLLRTDTKVIVSGRLSMREDQNNSILVDDVLEMQKKTDKKLFIRCDMENKQMIAHITAIIKRFPGNVPVVLFDENTRKQKLAPPEMYINCSSAFIDIMTAAVGEGNVKLN